MRCPNCPQEPETDLKFCRQCGKPTVASPHESANEPAAKCDADDDETTRSLTSRIGTVDLSSQSPARPVVPRADSEGGEPEPDARADAPPPPPREPGRADARARGRARGRSLRAADLAHYRSVQKLARALVVIHVTATAAVIALALVFVHTLNGWSDKAVALGRENATVNCRYETAQASLEQKQAEVAGLTQALVQRDGALVVKDGEIGKRDDRIRKLSEERDEARLALLSLNLDDRESKTVEKGLNAILNRAKGRNAIPELAARRADLEGLRGKIRRRENRTDLFKDYKRILPTLDEPTQAQFMDSVGRPLLGE